MSRAASGQERLIQEVLAELERRGSIRRSLQGGGLLSIDRGLPYLLVYRMPQGEDPGTARLVAGEASYVLAESGDGHLRDLVEAIAEAGSRAYGAFLVLEIWAVEAGERPTIVIRAPGDQASETVGALAEGLRDVGGAFRPVSVEVRPTDHRHPPDMPPLFSIHESWERGILLMGLEIPAVYRAETGELFPRYLRRFQGRLSSALRQAIYEFLRVQTACKVENHLALGTRAVPESIWSMDRELSAIERGFTFLLLVNPANEAQAWQQFQENGYDRDPVFHYRLLPIDPDLLKRRLYAIRMEEIEDPALSDLLQDKRDELDKLLGMLGERGTKPFLYDSMRLYGAVDDRLLELATALLDSVSPHEAEGPIPAPVSAEAFREAALRELDHYAASYPPARDRRVTIRSDLTGLMVSEGNLMIGEELTLAPNRVEPLLHHEVGTHVLTYVNGSAQPLEQLSLGLAGYDELQEGLAVLAEYLVNGLTPGRMRLLAARVVAAHSVEHGAMFVETFRLLTDRYGFTPGGAWNVAMRVHQCGGFTRDLIYLRGLVRLLDHLGGGAELEPLYIGKIAQRHVPIIEELRHRGVLREPPLHPRFLDHPGARDRLHAVREGLSVVDLVTPGAA